MREPFSVLDLAFIWGIAIKGGIHNSFPFVSVRKSSVSIGPRDRMENSSLIIGAV